MPRFNISVRMDLLLKQLGLGILLFLCPESFGFAQTEAQKERVVVGAYINDIQNLELKTHSYAVDLYVWFKWKNPKANPVENVEFMNPFDLWGHSRRNSYEKPAKLPSGEYYQVVRTQGKFSHKFNFSNYPFDRQVLTIEFEDNSCDVAQFVADQESVAVNPDLTIPGFIVGSPTLTIKDTPYPTHFGDTRNKGTGGGEVCSRVTLELPIIRPALTYSIKLLLPILCVIFCAALMFLFNPTYVDSRVGIGITALLTIVALQITLNEDLPEIDYLVLIDKIYLAAYLYVIAGLAVVVKTTWMLERNDVKKAIQVDRVSLIVLTAGFFFTMCLLVGLSLF